MNGQNSNKSGLMCVIYIRSSSSSRLIQSKLKMLMRPTFPVTCMVVPGRLPPAAACPQLWWCAHRSQLHTSWSESPSGWVSAPRLTAHRQTHEIASYYTVTATICSGSTSAKFVLTSPDDTRHAWRFRYQRSSSCWGKGRASLSFLCVCVLQTGGRKRSLERQ